MYSLRAQRRSVLQMAQQGGDAARLRELLAQRYQIDRDDRLLRRVVLEEDSPEFGFDRLRREYRERRELAGSTVRLRRDDERGEAMLRALACVPKTVGG